VSLGGMRDEAEIAVIAARISARCRDRSSRVCGARNRRTRYSSSTRSTSWGTTFRGIRRQRCSKVLDPEQNSTFRDHYLDVPFDLSEVLFITTANVLDPVPPALRDRMEVLELPGYTRRRSWRSRRDHLVQKQIKNHGLTSEMLTITDDALRRVIRGYTREAGVRNLERELSALCRKAARRRAEGNETPLVITPDVVTEMLGAPTFLDEEMEERTRSPAWRSVWRGRRPGGDVLFIEASRMAGTGTLTLTGQLGEVMKESARAALSWFRAHAAAYGADPDFFKNSEIHLHVPSGRDSRRRSVGGRDDRHGARVRADAASGARRHRDDR
jgi:ATP-dependent Lon protease